MRASPKVLGMCLLTKAAKILISFKFCLSKKNMITRYFSKFTYDMFGMTNGGSDTIYAGAEGAVTLVVRWRHMDERNVGL